MSMSVPGAKCALSGDPIEPGIPCFSTTGTFLPASDPLHKYCDSPILWEHYAAWPERRRFARAYVEEWIKANRNNPFWWTVHRDEDVYISVNPQRGIEEVSVRLMEVGNDVRVSLSNWPRWLEDPMSVSDHLHEVEIATLRRVLPKLRTAFPTARAIVEAIDPDEKQSRRK